jgi:hypothetical protein
VEVKGEGSPSVATQPQQYVRPRIRKLDILGRRNSRPSQLAPVTTRAYDLVVHYEEKSMGGTRWSIEGIEYAPATILNPVEEDVGCCGGEGRR